MRLLVPGRWRSYPKHRLARALLIHAKRNRYRDRRPVPERYFSAARDLGGGARRRPAGVLPRRRRPDEQVTAWLRSVGLRVRVSNIVAVAPGAAHATKRWPLGALAHAGGHGGQEVALPSSSWVGPTTPALGATLATGGSGRVASAAGVFGLQATGALLERARALVSGDTGVMHMATGVGTPVVALFGPTVEAFGFFPYASQASGAGAARSPAGPAPRRAAPAARWVTTAAWSISSPGLVYEALRSSLRMNGWDPAASALPDPVAPGRTRTQARRNLCPLADGAGRSGSAARPAAGGASSAPPGAGAGAPPVQPHHAAATAAGTRRGGRASCANHDRRRRPRC